MLYISITSLKSPFLFVCQDRTLLISLTWFLLLHLQHCSLIWHCKMWTVHGLILNFVQTLFQWLVNKILKYLVKRWIQVSKERNILSWRNLTTGFTRYAYLSHRKNVLFLIWDNITNDQSSQDNLRVHTFKRLPRNGIFSQTRQQHSYSPLKFGKMLDKGKKELVEEYLLRKCKVSGCAEAVSRAQFPLISPAECHCG